MEVAPDGKDIHKYNGYPYSRKLVYENEWLGMFSEVTEDITVLRKPIHNNHVIVHHLETLISGIEMNYIGLISTGLQYGVVRGLTLEKMKS